MTNRWTREREPASNVPRAPGGEATLVVCYVGARGGKIVLIRLGGRRRRGRGEEEGDEARHDCRRR